MTKKVIIAGSRSFKDYALMEHKLSRILCNMNKKEIKIITGGARGGDRLGIKYATANGLKIAKIEADYEKHGNYAMHLRNEKMIKAADYLIAFYDGRSRMISDLIALAKIKGIPMRIIRYREEDQQ